MDFCEIPSGAPPFKITPPSEGKVLLHACCAPCSTAVLECMVANGLRPTVFFSNSNIVPLEEYALRKEELRSYCAIWGLDFVDDDYDHSDWLSKVASGLEDAPERGPRCLQCFKYRLLRAARYAEKEGFALLATTLASSRWKSLEQVDEAGEWACAQVDGPRWWAQNWRKGGLQPRRSQLIEALGMYNQPWCGCEFSKRDASI